MIDLIGQRQSEVDYHSQVLQKEFGKWLAISKEPDAPFAKHKSQIEQITSVLLEFIRIVDSENIANDRVKTESAYKKILGVYRIWSYFRSKFIMREDELIGNILKCADELANACYEPARDRAKATGLIDTKRLKAPPLVFFSNDARPFAQPRNTPFMPEGLSMRDMQNFERVILSLPVPIIGIPWFQVNHVPALPIIAHEVGHAVEIDFGLEDILNNLFGSLGIDEERRPAWVSWRKEIFADVYACLCIGPAFLLALIDFLQGTKTEIEQENLSEHNWGLYPTRSLRIKLNLFTLKELGLLSSTEIPEPLKKFLEAFERTWFSEYPEHRMKVFEDDIEAVITPLLKARFDVFGNIPFEKVMSYEVSDLTTSWYLSKKVLSNSNFLPQIRPWTYRSLAAAPRLAYSSDSHKYQEKEGNSTSVRELLSAIPTGNRDSDLRAELPADQVEEVLNQRLEVHREIARSLMDFF